MSKVSKFFNTNFGNSKLHAIMILFIIFAVSVSYAQVPTGEIRGSVIAEDAEYALPGTKVVLLGTNYRGATDANGSYVITNIPSGVYKLRCSFIGYKTQEKDVTVMAGQEIVVNFELETDILKMDDIVFTGTGSELRRKELTTRIQTISKGEIDASAATNVQELLQGRLQGGQVKAVGGQAGQGMNIRLRGFKSIYADQTPVIYIDGVRVENRSNLGLNLGSTGSSALADIHVENIDRIEVLKGGTTSTLYGSEGAAGVIQIFTKVGTPGKARWRFNVKQGWDVADDRYIRTGLDPDNLIRDLEFRTAHTQKYGIGVSGGSNLITYDINLALQGNSGVYHKTGHSYHGLNSSFRLTPNDKMKINLQTRLSRDRYDRTWSGTGYNSAIVAVLLGDYPFKGDPAITKQEKVDEVGYYHLPDAHDVTWRTGVGLTTTYDYNDYVNSMLTLGVDYRKSEQRYYEPREFGEYFNKPSKGMLQRDDREYMTFTFDFKTTLKYPKEGSFTSAFTVGVQGFRRDSRVIRATGYNFSLPGSRDIDNADRIIAFEYNEEVFNDGIFINEQIGFMDKLFLTLGFRIDGNILFGRKGKTSGIETASYPKAAIAYNISDESFWQDMPFRDVLSTLKFRAAYGETGAGVYRNYSQGIYIKPERMATTEFGFDIALFDGRIGLNIDHYSDKTTDAFLFVPNDPFSGQGSSQQNVGEISNKGWEIAGNINIWNSGGINVSLNGSFMTIDNEVTSLGGVPGFELALNNRVEEGMPIGVLEIFTPELNTTGAPLAPEDELDPRFTGDYYSKYYQPFADHIYNLGLQVSIGRNFTFRIYGDGQWGGHTINLTRWYRSTATGAIMVPYLEGDHMVFNGGLVPLGYDDWISFASWIEKSDYFKVRELSASYRIPKKIFGMDVTVNVAARNFWNLYVPNQTIDPELDAARVEAEFSPPIQYSFGVIIDL